MTAQTKDQITDALTAAQDEIERWRRADQQRDADARAIDLCVKALDVLWKANERQYGNTLSYPPQPPAAGSVERVLTYLRQRYGIRDATGERDALRSELEQAQRELANLRERFSVVTQAVSP